MAAKRVGDRVFERSANQISVDPELWENAKEDKKRIDVLNWDAMFDDIFRHLLEGNFSRPQQDKHVKELFNTQYGPLASLTNKARLAYVLDLIDKTTCEDLGKAHKIRNRFAHGLKIDFTDSEVVKLVKDWHKQKSKTERVTAENSYKVYLSIMADCFSNIMKVIEQDEARIKAEIKKERKKAK